jgi:hypothetical protein
MTNVSLRNLQMPTRVLFSCFLIMIGIGYLAAILYLFLIDVAPHAAQGKGMIEGIAEKYHGAPTRLELALRGPMADRIGPQDKDRIFSWIREGATAEGYASVKPIIETACVQCHRAGSGVKRPNGDPVPAFDNYEALSDLIQIDTGPGIAQLAKVSHVHLFGISLIFFATGFIVSLSETPPWFRIALIVTPYAAILADIGSWWLTKWQEFFGVVVVIGGALMGLALALQILISLWDMWLAGPMAPLKAKVSGQTNLQGVPRR